MKFQRWLVLAALQGAVALGAAPAEMQDSIRHYTADHHTVSRAYDMPWSQTRFEHFESLYHDWQQQLPKLDFDALNQQGRIDYVLLRNELTSELNRLELQKRRLTEMDELLSFRGAIHELEMARWSRKPVDAQSAATKISHVAEQVKKLKERVEKGKKGRDDKKPAATNEVASASHDAKEKSDVTPLKVSPVVARRTANAVTEIRSTLKSWYSFYDGSQPEFTWWLKKPYEEASSALESYAKYLREEIAGLKGKDEDPLLGEAIGREALLRDLAVEMIPYTPEELIAIGEKEFAWCEAEMRKAAKEMGFDDWKQALAKVKSDFVPPGQQDDWVAQMARESIDFVKSHDLVTITPLCEEAWRLTMVSTDGQKSLPYAAYGGQSIMVAYAKEDMKQ